MGYIQTENGTIWENPPPAPTHKTKGLDQTEYRGLYSKDETFRLDKLKKLIDLASIVDGEIVFSYQLSGGAVGLDDDAALVGAAGSTYRDLMRSSFEAFAGASKSGIDMDNSITVLGVNCQELLGLLDSPSRKATILLGKPL